jgi:two-component system, sporulation sensor kinase A
MNGQTCDPHTKEKLFTLLSMQPGLTFGFRKDSNKFIHTFIYGQMMPQLQLTEESFLNQELHTIFPAALAKRKLSYYESAWHGIPVQYESTLHGISFLTKLTPVTKDGHEVVEVIAACTPILQPVHDVQFFLAHLSDPTILTDLEGNVTRVNPAFTQLYGWEEHEVIGSMLPMVPEKFRDDARQVHLELLQSGQTIEFETLNQNKRGALFPTSVTLSLLRDQSGEPTGIIGIAKDLSERNQMRQKLAATEDNYRLITEHMTDYILMLDVSGRVKYASPSLSYLFNQLPFQTEELQERVDPADHEKMLSCFQQIIEHKMPLSAEFRYKKNGEWIYCDTKGTPILSPAGEVESVMFVTRDITDRKRTELALQEAEEKYRNLVEEALVGVYLYQDRKFVYVNPRMADIFGYTTAEIYEIDPFELLTSSLRELVMERLPQLELQNDLHFQAEGLRKDGTKIYFELSGKQTFYNGKPASIGTLLDITERRKAEKVINESDKRYRRLLDLSPEPILVHSSGIIVYLNDACLRLLHAKSRSQIVGTSLTDYLHPDSHATALQRIATVDSFKENLTYMEYTMLSLDGQTKEIEASSTKIDVVLGIPVIQTVLRDITEKKRTEEMFRRSDKLSALGQMAAGIAHEIRNPLTSLKGFVQLLRSQVPKHPEYFEIMLSELDRINQIVTEFMKIAKPQTTVFQQKDMSEIVDSIVALMNSQAILHNIEIRVALEPALPVIYCDENQLKQVFINVLKNAMEAMQHGGSIQIRARVWNERAIEVLIIDQGPGIPEAYLAKLGDPFFTTKETGTGLGLMVCYQIIEAHQGTFQISSEMGKGTQVQIRLPIHKGSHQST